MQITVESAVKLSANQLDQLQTKLASLSRQEIIINNVVDPNVVAGLRIITPHKTLDLSLAAKLNQLRQSLLAS